MKKNILIIDDEALLRNSIAEYLGDSRFAVFTAASGREGLRVLEGRPIDLVLLDLKLPDANGIAVLREIRDRSPATIVFIITAYGNIEVAVEAVKAGAEDFLTKPFELAALKLKVRRLFETGDLRDQLGYLQEKGRESFTLDSFLGECVSVRRLKEHVSRLAASPDTPVIIEGATGTGKGLLAKIVHYTSPRSRRPFVEINCAAVPENLLEAELFGYEPGAFTDAKTVKKGLFEVAVEGTLFLDEIGDMSPGLQAKLLKILEDRSLRRLGGTVPIECDTRIIAATNQDLSGKVRKGLFRKDLYFRLHVLSLNIPSLRERGNDVVLLADHFIRRFSLEFKRPVGPVSGDLKKVLLDYGWPGNVRELRNVLERFFILENETVIRPEHLKLGGLGGPDSDGSGPTIEAGKLRLEVDLAELDLRELVKMVIQQVLKATGLNQVKAARLLRISRDNLRYRMKKYGIPGKSRNTGPGVTGSGEAGSGDAGSGDAGSGEAESGDAGSGDAGSGEAESGETGS